MTDPAGDARSTGSMPPELVGLSVHDLPDVNDRAGIVRFAGRFQGYLRFGSFEACAAHATARRRETLVDLMNELFFSLRASRHGGHDGFMDDYAELRPLIAAKLALSNHQTPQER